MRKQVQSAGQPGQTRVSLQLSPSKNVCTRAAMASVTEEPQKFRGHPAKGVGNTRAHPKTPHSPAQQAAKLFLGSDS